MYRHLVETHGFGEEQHEPSTTTTIELENASDITIHTESVPVEPSCRNDEKGGKKGRY